MRKIFDIVLLLLLIFISYPIIRFNLIKDLTPYVINDININEILSDKIHNSYYLDKYPIISFEDENISYAIIRIKKDTISPSIYLKNNNDKSSITKWDKLYKSEFGSIFFHNNIHFSIKVNDYKTFLIITIIKSL